MMILYATLAACVLLTPRQIVEHLQSAEPNAAIALAARAMTRVDMLSQRLGAQQAFDRARRRFVDGPFPPPDEYRLRAALAP